MRYNFQSQKSQSGIAAMMTVIIIGAAGLLMAFSASMIAIGELEQGYIAQQGAEAFSVADGCVEEGLRRIRVDATYGSGGTINLTVDNGSCTIDVTDLGGGQRRIVVNGNVGDYYKKMQVELTLSGNSITIDSWEELST